MVASGGGLVRQLIQLAPSRLSLRPDAAVDRPAVPLARRLRRAARPPLRLLRSAAIPVARGWIARSRSQAPSERRRSGNPGRTRVCYVMFDAHGLGGTIRTVFTMVEKLARTHDVEIVSVATGTREPFFPLPTGASASVLEDRARPPEGWTVADLLERALRRLPSVLWEDTEGAYPHVSLWIDVQLVRFLRNLDADIVVGTRHGLNVLLAELAPPDVRTVGQMHTSLRTQHPDLQAAVRKHCGRLDVLVVLTHEEERFSRELLGSSVRIVRIPNALPPITAAPSSTGGTDVVAVGRLDRPKGFDLLVEAYTRVAEVRPDWNLRIFGKGPDGEALQRLIDERGLRGRVHLMGPSTDVPAELSKAALYVLSSRSEGFPMVLLEAMGVGLPVVSFDCPYGPNELVEHGVNGLLVPAEDVEGLAAAMLRLMDDDEARRRMGRRALEAVRPYSPEVIAAEWAALYADLVTSPSHAGQRGG